MPWLESISTNCESRPLTRGKWRVIFPAEISKRLWWANGWQPVREFSLWMSQRGESTSGRGLRFIGYLMHWLENGGWRYWSFQVISPRSCGSSTVFWSCAKDWLGPNFSGGKQPRRLSSRRRWVVTRPKRPAHKPTSRSRTKLVRTPPHRLQHQSMNSEHTHGCTD